MTKIPRFCASQVTTLMSPGNEKSFLRTRKIVNMLFSLFSLEAGFTKFILKFSTFSYAASQNLKASQNKQFRKLVIFFGVFVLNLKQIPLSL